VCWLGLLPVRYATYTVCILEGGLCLYHTVFPVRYAIYTHTQRVSYRGGVSMCALMPLPYWLLTPELQWRSRGQMAYLAGVCLCVLDGT
jgi:hypothetical protein